MGAAHVSITFDIFNFKHLVEIVRYAGIRYGLLALAGKWFGLLVNDI